MSHDLNILLRLAVVIVLSGVLGWEREKLGKAAGLRTHILVGFSATLFVALGESMIEHFRPYHDRLQFDPIRIIEAIVAGVSFLGAGTIFMAKQEQRITGLTTAAAVLATAAVGIAVGVERYVIAVGATAIIFGVLRVLGRWEVQALNKEPAPPQQPNGDTRSLDVKEPAP
jgi:putative Mg2+ transporter-C (MgtC) family protein